MSKSFYVYAHKRATDGTIFYIGKGHALRAWSRNKRNAHWHSVANKHGLIVEIVERCWSEVDAFESERRLIADCKARSIALTNKTDGGEGPAGMRHTEDTKAKWAAAKRGSKRGPQSEDHRRNISLSQIGKTVSTVTRARIAASTSQAMKRPEVVNKMRLAKLGKTRQPHSDETKAKMRAASIGRPKSADARANMSIAQKKRFHPNQPEAQCPA